MRDFRKVYLAMVDFGQYQEILKNAMGIDRFCYSETTNQQHVDRFLVVLN